MYSEILAEVRTQSDAEKLLEEIRLLQESLYEQKRGGFEEVLRTSVRVRVAELIKNSFAQAGVERRDFLQGLAEVVTKLKTLNLTLAFEPSQEAIEQVSDWVRGNVGEGVIVDIQYDKSILGGATLTYQGKYADFSLRKRLEKEFKPKLKR